jgi:ubiquinone/menaquinone biosynthesis C-methylase UbiE
MPDINWNITTWSSRYDWSNEGEEWSEAWGSSYAQWIVSIYPRIGMILPSQSILEIAPGFGRWTKFLVQFTNRYYGVDVSEKCIEHCKRKFRAVPHAEFHHNDGKSLEIIPNSSIDFVFSYDSLVHVDVETVSEYLTQILAKLTKNGIAYVHHSNFAELLMDDPANNVECRHMRDTTTSCKAVQEIISNNGGKVLVQEKINWGTKAEKPIDGMTLFCKSNADLYEEYDYQLLDRLDMAHEYRYARNIDKYLRVSYRRLRNCSSYDGQDE